MIGISCVFNAKVESLGYIPGNRYPLVVQKIPGGGLRIIREHGGGVCEYESFSAFFYNWTGLDRRDLDQIENLDSWERQKL